MYKKIIAMVLSICISAQLMSTVVYAQENVNTALNTENKNVTDIDENIINVSSIVSFKNKTVENIVEQSKFRARQGHGFAAERGNNLADKIKGKNTIVVGDNNVKNGADRLIINRDGTKIWIQDKYYKTAKAGIDACFDDLGNFRYIDGDGNPMLIEVPSDQYDDAVMYMRQQIETGKIPKVSDPDEAVTIVKKGALTYKQAVNLAKAGTIESLTYDAVNGTVSAGAAFGISTIINYAVNRFNGVSREESLKLSAKEGLKTGGLAFGSYVISAQLSKTGIMEVFKPSSEALVKALGKDFADALVLSTGKTGIKVTTEQAAKVLRSNALVSTVTVVVFTVPDAIDLFQGRISKKQFIKNFAVTAVSVVAGSAGYVVGGAVGNLVVPGVGTVPGAIVGSLVFGVAGGWGADVIADYITDDDADEMYEIVQNSFAQKCEDYILDETEAQRIVNEFSKMLTEDMFKDMYQSENREQFIEEKMTPLFEQEVAKREVIAAPTEEEMRESLKTELNGVIFIH